MEKTNMRTFESSLITDFFKDQNWRCRAAIATLRNRMGDDWVDLFLLDCCVDQSELSVEPLYFCSWHIHAPPIDTLKDFKQKHSQEKYGWIDTFLMSIILQVVLKYFLKWLIENFTMDVSGFDK